MTTNWLFTDIATVGIDEVEGEDEGIKGREKIESQRRKIVSRSILVPRGNKAIWIRSK